MVFTTEMFEKHLWKSDILSEDAGHRPAYLFIMSFFQHFASNNKLPGFYISGTMVGNGLVVKTSEWRQLKMAKVRINLSLTFLCNIYMMKVNTIIETLEQGAKYAPSSL